METTKIVKVGIPAIVQPSIFLEIGLNGEYLADVTTAIFQLTVNLPHDPKQIQIMVTRLAIHGEGYTNMEFRSRHKKRSTMFGNRLSSSPEPSSTPASISNIRANQ